MIDGRLGGGACHGCVGLLFEPLSNWLHILLMFRQSILQGMASALLVLLPLFEQ